MLYYLFDERPRFTYFRNRNVRRKDEPRPPGCNRYEDAKRAMRQFEELDSESDSPMGRRPRWQIVVRWRAGGSHPLRAAETGRCRSFTVLVLAGENGGADIGRPGKSNQIKVGIFLEDETRRAREDPESGKGENRVWEDRMNKMNRMPERKSAKRSQASSSAVFYTAARKR